MPGVLRSFFLVGVFFLSAVSAHDVKVPKVIGELPVERLTKKIHLVSAPLESPSKYNEGFIANTGFVVTDAGVVVIDPGSSVQIGRKLLEKIDQTTGLPVVAVINTHVHGDHWLGNQAIVEKFPGVKIYAHHRMIERLKNGEGDTWVGIMKQLTEGVTDGTVAIPPNQGVDHGDSVNIGGTKFNIHFQGKAHTDTDIMIEVVEDNAMFMGDIVMVGRISSQPQDGDIKGQIKAIQYALATETEFFIPGHGKAGDRDVPRKTLAFLEKLYESVARYYEEGLDVTEMKSKVTEDLSDYKGWSGFESLGRVISFTYLKVEEELF
ncbi:MAG: MBL fold metallo-hydrolase [Gammaproteobacteria bacterium]|nr:MBL fold metallo-hydrolase [Gammaproteobacteria bacterium]